MTPNRFCELAGCRYPIVQTGMGWVSGASLTAATAAAGGFGFLAAATMARPQLQTAMDQVRERTDAPFGVNFRADQADLQDLLEDAVGRGVRLIGFAGPPSATTIARLRDEGVGVVVSVGARRHAEKVLEAGADAVIAQGAEGGGHTGTVPTSLLLPEVVRAVGADIPVLAAGGFHDGRGLVAALAHGADGIAMGTRFLLTAESQVPDAVKRRYLQASVFDTVVTDAIDGVHQRVVRTPMIDRLEGRRLTRLPRSAAAAWAFQRRTRTPWRHLLQESRGMRTSRDLSALQLVMAANAPVLTRAALVEGDVERGVLPSGQCAGVIEDLPTVAEVVEAILAEARATLGRLHEVELGVTP